MLVFSPWSLARRCSDGRRALLLVVVAALLYGFSMHAARACLPSAAAVPVDLAAAGDLCHGEIDVAKAMCEVHCSTDAQGVRELPSFELPAAMPPDPSASLAPLVPIGSLALSGAPQRRNNGPPLHILLHRLLR